jgi:hypothetical protein
MPHPADSELLERLFLMCQMAGHYVVWPIDRDMYLSTYFILDFDARNIFGIDHAHVTISFGQLVVERGISRTPDASVVRAQNLLAPMMCALHTNP